MSTVWDVMIGGSWNAEAACFMGLEREMLVLRLLVELMIEDTQRQAPDQSVLSPQHLISTVGAASSNLFRSQSIRQVAKAGSSSLP